MYICFVMPILQMYMNDQSLQSTMYVQHIHVQHTNCKPAYTIFPVTAKASHLCRMCGMCNAHTPYHSKKTDKAWYSPKCILHLTLQDLLHNHTMCTCTYTSQSYTCTLTMEPSSVVGLVNGSKLEGGMGSRGSVFGWELVSPTTCRLFCVADSWDPSSTLSCGDIIELLSCPPTELTSLRLSSSIGLSFLIPSMLSTWNGLTLTGLLSSSVLCCASEWISSDSVAGSWDSCLSS